MTERMRRINEAVRYLSGQEYELVRVEREVVTPED